jgi:uncharacterized protein (TIGR03437 family)
MFPISPSTTIRHRGLESRKGRHLKTTNFIVFTLLFTCALSASAQPFSYQPILFEPPAPTPRIDSPIVYVPASQTLYIFGGRGPGLRNDLWAYSFTQAAWTELSPAGQPPPPRLGHTMVLDTARQRLIVFGGQATGFFSDTWAYDIAANTWQQLAPDNAGPNRRYGHSAIYDETRDAMVISHGFTDDGRFDDTWAFDLATNTWTDISPPTRPLPRCLHHAVYDPQRDQMLLFGGCASGFGPCPLNDLWSFDLAERQWRRLDGGPAPPARQWYGTAFDTDRGAMIIFAGSGSGGFLADTWSYDAAAETWQQLTVGGPSPSPRSRLEGAYVPGMGIVFWGGQTANGLAAELWLLAAAEPEIRDGGVANAFNFATGSVSPGEIISIFTRNAGPSEGLATVFDPVTGLLPFTAAGVSVTFNGLRAALYYLREDQLNVQAPYELAGAPEAELIVIYQGVASAPVRIPIAPTRTGLFPVVFNADGSQNSAANPAGPNTVIVLFLTGQGVTTPPSPTGAFPTGVFPEPVAPVSIEIGGHPATIEFKGQAPFTAGVMQLNARLHPTLGPGSHTILIRIGEALSQSNVTVFIAE